MTALLLRLLDRAGVKSNIARNSVYLLGAEAITRAINLIVGRIVLLRYLKPEGAGTMTVVMDFGLMAAIIAEFGISQAAVRMIARRPREDLGRLLGAVASLRIALTGVMLLVLGGTLLTPLGLKFEPEVRLLILIWSASLALQAFRRNSEVVFQALEKLKYQAMFLITKTLIAAVLIIGAVYFGLGLVAIFVAYLIADAADCLFAAWFVRRHIQRAEYRTSRADAFSLFFESIPFALHLAATQAHFYADSILINFLARGSVPTVRAEVGLYSSAYKLVVTLMFIPVSVCNALYPTLSRAYHNDRPRLNDLFAHSFNLLFLAGPLVALPLFTFRTEFLVILFGEAYRPAASMMALVIWALPLSFLATPLSVLLAATDRQKIVTISSFINAVFCIGLNFMIIPRMGGHGAALSTTLTMLLSCILQFTPIAFVMPHVFNYKKLGIITMFHAAGIGALLALDDSPVIIRATVLITYMIVLAAYGKSLAATRLRSQRGDPV